MPVNHRIRPLIAVLAVLALLAAAGLLAWRTAARRDLSRATAEYRQALARWNVPADPEPRDVRPGAMEKQLMAAGLLLEPEPGEGATLDTAFRLSSKPFGQWTAGELKAARAAVERSREALGLARRAAGSMTEPRPLVLPTEGREHTVMLLGLLRTVRLLRVEAALETAAGRPGAALEDLRAAGRLAAALEATPSLVSLLVGEAAEGLVHRGLAEALADGLLAGKEAEAREILPSVNLDDTFRRAVVANHLRVLRDIRSLAAQYGSSGRFSRRLASMLGVPLEEIERADALRFTAWVLDLSATPWVELARNTPSGPRLSRLGGPASRTMLPNLSSGLGRTQATTAARHLARTALELAREGRSRGAYPAELPPALRVREPFCGCEPRLERRPGGGADLTLPGAEALDRELMQNLPGHVLRWQLPEP